MSKEMRDMERKILESGASSREFSFPRKSLLVMWLWVRHRTQIWSLYRTAAGKSVCNILSEIHQIRGRRAFWSEEGRTHHWICRTWVKCQKMNRILADTIMKGEYVTQKSEGLSSVEERIEDKNSPKRESLCFPFPYFWTYVACLFEMFMCHSIYRRKS